MFGQLLGAVDQLLTLFSILLVFACDYVGFL